MASVGANALGLERLLGQCGSPVTVMALGDLLLVRAQCFAPRTEVSPCKDVFSKHGLCSGVSLRNLSSSGFFSSLAFTVRKEGRCGQELLGLISLAVCSWPRTK